MSIRRICRSGRPWIVTGLAVACFLASGCYNSGDFSPTRENLESVIALSSVTGNTSLAADGFSRLRLEARLLGAPATDRRTVLFRVNSPLGTLQGGTTDGDAMAVEADATGRAPIDFVAGMTPGTAVVTATPKTAPGVTISLDITLSPPDPDGIVRFVVAPSRAAADGATLTTFTVEASLSLPASTMVRFTTSESSFSPQGATSIDVPILGDGRASADLKSPATITVARVGATVQGITRETVIEFVRALPDAIDVTASTLSVPAELGSEVTINAKLRRAVGTVTDGTVATFRAVTDAGVELTSFDNIQASSGGSVSATFRPRTELPGFVTVTVSAEGAGGKSVSGTVRIELTAP